MREREEEFRISLPLVYLIQQTTKQTTPEILAAIKLLSEQLIAGASDKFRRGGTKELRGFWPDTSIYFRLRVSCYKDALFHFSSPYIKYSNPQISKTSAKKIIDEYLNESEEFKEKILIKSAISKLIKNKSLKSEENNKISFY